MPSDFQKLLAGYDYQLPAELIAQKPKTPRDSAKLLIFHRRSKQLSFDTFANIGKYLPPKTVLVLNQTKVIPARLRLKKSTGGAVEMLYLGHNSRHIRALANRKLSVGSQVSLPSTKLTFTVAKKDGQFYYLRPSFNPAQILNVLKRHGTTPLPPYIKHSPLNERQKRSAYQAVFAKAGKSVAAPTASLHFSKPLLRHLKNQGLEIRFINLDVGLGTFAPLTEAQLKAGQLHEEVYNISPATAAHLEAAKERGQAIVPVGTTAMRTLESAATKNGRLTKLKGQTQLFIRPGYRFKFADGLITNFHVPKSSLMMLVAALTGKAELLKLYQTAIARRYRFFSFGDGMLILP